jgi:hypothetical protein
LVRVEKSKAKYDADVAKLEDIHENKDEIMKRSYCKMYNPTVNCRRNYEILLKYNLNREIVKMEYHRLDAYPIPKDKTPLYINEPWLIDNSIMEIRLDASEPEQQDDNVRIYIPLDINKKAVLRRLQMTIARYGEANEKNESDFRMDVEALISHVEIYDQIWYVRHMPPEGKHSKEAIELVKEIIVLLEEIPDSCAETFPFEMIDSLKDEYFR